MPRQQRPGLWSISSYILLSLFLAIFLFLGLLNQSTYVGLRKRPKYNFPNFDRISTFTRVLSEHDVNINDTNSRILIVGDVHGMNESLHDLLTRTSYNPRNDVLIFAGDLLAKSSHTSSLSVIDFLTKNHNFNGTERIFPVRGNHDQLVVQWRAWREWFEELTLPATAASHAPFFFRSPAEAATLFASTISSVFRQGVSAGDEMVKLSRKNQTPPISTGREFLQLIEAEWALEKVNNEPDPEEYADVARKRALGTWREAWWRRIPPPGKGRNAQSWNLFTDHYWLARDITPAQATYLSSLPLVLHLPHLHLFIVHAGLLPSDPRLPPTDPRQPLAHMPHIQPEHHPIGYDPDTDVDSEEDREDAFITRLRANMLALKAQEQVETPGPVQTIADTLSMLQANATLNSLRQMQETALLEEIPQNRDGWVVLNIRSVKKKGKVTRNGEVGTPWSELWNDHMGWCDGFEEFTSSSQEFDIKSESQPSAFDLQDGAAHTVKKKKPKYSLLCHPSTVVYGHAASRDLDIKRWSMGIDTGCLYGRKLTALVLSAPGARGGDGGGGDDDDDEDDEDDEDNHDEDDKDSDDDDLDFDDDEWDAGGVKPKRIRFGDRRAPIKARLISVQCPTIDNHD